MFTKHRASRPTWAALALLAAACGPAPPGEREARSEVPEPPSGKAERPLERLPEGEAGDVVRRGIEAGGGWQAWEATETVSYEKTTVRFGPNGEPESTRVERHRYRLHPSLAVRIDYTDADGREVSLRNDGDEAWKLVDGELATSEDDRNHAWNSTFGSHYVFSMPFKLTDPGANLESVGRSELPDGTLADGVRVSYEPWAGSSGAYHVWTYWFAADDARLVANRLDFGPEPDDHDYTEYFDHRRVGDLHLPTRRISYQSNPEGERLHPLSEISYAEIELEAPLPDRLFRPPG